jgi:hypothetical protein
VPGVEKRCIGWDPDLNDGVILNIAPLRSGPVERCGDGLGGSHWHFPGALPISRAGQGFLFIEGNLRARKTKKSISFGAPLSLLLERTEPQEKKKTTRLRDRIYTLNKNDHYDRKFLGAVKRFTISDTRRPSIARGLR